MKIASFAFTALLVLTAAHASATPVLITFDPGDPNATHPYTVSGPGQSTYDPNQVYQNSLVSFGDAVILVDSTRPDESSPGVLDNIGTDMQVLFSSGVDDVSFYSTVNTQGTLYVYINGVVQPGQSLTVNPGSIGLVTVSGSDITELAFVYAQSGNNSIDNLSFNTIPFPPAVTPEPSSLVLLGTGLLGICGVARRRLLRS